MICHLALLLAVLPSLCAAQRLVVAPDNTNGVYSVGDTVRWRAEWQGDKVPPEVTYTFKRGGLTPEGSGALTFSNGLAELQSQFHAPGSMLLELTWKTEEGTESRAVAGAVADPSRITLSAPRPADFDDFWTEKLKELKQVRANPRLTPVESGGTNVACWHLTMDNIRGTRIHGQIARPARGRKLPALLIVQWAGVYPLEKNWVIDRAAEGWLTLNIHAHDLPIDKPKEFYAAQSSGPLKDYPSIGNEDRETSYFLRMYLACYRAADYLTERKDWDGRTLVVMGDSQGGQQALMLAGLHPRGISAVVALVPAGCDMLGPKAGRAPGWPWWYFNVQGGKDAQKVRETSRYYDVACFASRIRCPALIGVGLRDEVCPPEGIIAAFNQISAPKQLVIMPQSGHQNANGSQSGFDRLRWQVWLPAMRQGHRAPVAD